MNTAIDFRKLLREEKKKIKKSREQRTQDQTKEDEATTTSKATTTALVDETRASVQPLPPWSLRLGEDDDASNDLSLGDLKPICLDPPLLRYQSKFLDIEYRNALLQWLQALPHLEYDPKQTHPGIGWTTLPYAQRRVAVFSHSMDGSSVSSSTLPEALHPLVQAVTPLFPPNLPPNHLLINWYYSNTTTTGSDDAPHQKGIMPHTDGPAYYNLTCTISMGSNVILNFTPMSTTTTTTTTTTTSTTATLNSNKDTSKNNVAYPLQVLLSGQGSLVVFSHDLYSTHLHSIDDSSKESPSNDNRRNVLNKCHMTGTDDVLVSDSQHLLLPVLSPDERISITIRHKYTGNPDDVAVV